MAMTKEQRNRLFDLREDDSIRSLVGWDRRELDRLEVNAARRRIAELESERTALSRALADAHARIAALEDAASAATAAILAVSRRTER